MKIGNLPSSSWETDYAEASKSVHKVAAPKAGKHKVLNAKFHNEGNTEGVELLGIRVYGNDAPIKIIGISHKTLKNDGKVGAANGKAEVRISD